MSDTLLDIVKEVLRDSNQVVSISAFSDVDDTNYIVDRLNDALEVLYTLSPTQVDADGTITITPSTRKFNGPTGLDINRIYDWSYRISDSLGDIKLEFVSKRFIVERYPLFETHEYIRPQFVYLDNSQIAFYPLLNSGASNLACQFSYPAQFAKLTTTTATVPFPDRSFETRFIKKYAKFSYETFKGLGNAAISMQECAELLSSIKGKYARTKRLAITGYMAGQRRPHNGQI